MSQSIFSKQKTMRRNIPHDYNSSVLSIETLRYELDNWISVPV